MSRILSKAAYRLSFFLLSLFLLFPSLSSAQTIPAGVSSGASLNITITTYDQAVAALSQLTPEQLAALEIVSKRQVAAGDEHSLYLDEHGQVYSWGSNTYGQLGDGDGNRLTAVPTPIPGLTSAVAIAAGGLHSVVLMADGTVKTFGYNNNGQLCDGSTDNSYQPVTVPNLSGVKAIAAHATRTVLIKADDSVWWCGNPPLRGSAQTTPALIENPDGTPLQGEAIAAGQEAVLSLSNGSVQTWGLDFEIFSIMSLYDDYRDYMVTGTAEPVPWIHDTLSIAAGGMSFLAADKHGRVWQWGVPLGGDVMDYPQETDLSNPLHKTGLVGIRQVAAGGGAGLYYVDHGLALSYSGNVWGWGSNDDGQLGNGTTDSSVLPTPVEYLTNVTRIAAGSHHSLAVTFGGGVWQWGKMLVRVPSGVGDHTMIQEQIATTPQHIFP